MPPLHSANHSGYTQNLNFKPRTNLCRNSSWHLLSSFNLLGSMDQWEEDCVIWKFESLERNFKALVGTKLTFLHVITNAIIDVCVNSWRIIQFMEFNNKRYLASWPPIDLKIWYIAITGRYKNGESTERFKCCGVAATSGFVSNKSSTVCEWASKTDFLFHFSLDFVLIELKMILNSF